MSSLVTPSRNLNPCERMQKGATTFDIYALPFRLYMTDSQNTYKTLLGFTMTVLTLVLVSGYAAYKFTVLLDIDDYKIQIRNYDNYYDIHDDFT